MTRPLLCFLPGADHLKDGLSARLDADIAEMIFRNFPDGENYLRFLTDPAGRQVALVACLDRPDPKLVPLLFAAMTARDLGAQSVGLIAPYMPYFRQDIAFHSGESVSARHIGALLSANFSWVVTLDPHLHRLASLGDVFTIPGALAHAATAMAAWIGANVPSPILLGPDSESAQWVSAIADACGAPYAVFAKTRLGDTDVRIDVPADVSLDGRTPVIADDIISSGTTLVTLIHALIEAGSPPPVCCAVHGVFAGDAYDRLRAAGRIVTTNSIAHETNAIDITGALAEAVLSIAPGFGTLPPGT